MASKNLGPFLDALQPEMAVAYAVHPETHAPILDDNPQPVAVPYDLDLHFLALTVAAGIGQALLNDAKHRVFKDRCQIELRHAGAELDLDLVPPLAFLDKVLDGDENSPLVELR